MGKIRVATIPEEMLESGATQSDRYVYSNYFVPLLVIFDGGDTPILPFYVKQQLLELVSYGGLNRDRLDAILQELGMAELWSANAMAQAHERFLRTSSVPVLGRAAASAAEVGAAGSGAGRARAAHHVADSLEGIANTILETDRYLAALASHLDETGQELLNVASERLTWSARELAEHEGDGGRSRGPVLVEGPPPSVLDEQDVELVAGLLRSTVGYAFLDRTRVSPVGFAVGEHVYALGLAPGEQVVLEQKTFSKRQATLEEQTDQERQLETELASTYSTELQEGFERQRSLTDSWGLTFSKTGSYSSPISVYGQWSGTHSGSYTKNVTSASQEARRRSVKDSQEASGKVSARYRTQHKTVFRVTTEQGFEATSRRTIRNPNQATPITLHYFKVLQRLRLRQERYGVRLCWAPSVRDPGRTFYEQVQAGRRRLLDEAEAQLPERPRQPPPPGATSGGTGARERKPFWSERVTADQHNFLNAQRSVYTVDVGLTSGWSWDEVASNVLIDSSSTQRTPGTYLIYRVSTPLLVEGKVRVLVQVDAGERPGAQQITFQVGVIGVRDATVPANAKDDVAYQAALEDWRSRVADWEEAREEALEQAATAADAFERQAYAQLSPVNELIGQIVERHFPPGVRDEAWEIDYWQRLFDWERASFAAYPRWWSSGAVRDPLRDPSDFINASWAKLYLPVRLGMEMDALRWIFGKAVTRRLTPQVEKRFEEIVEELRTFRKDVIGAADELVELTQPCQSAPEKFACLAEWDETMPTDGTHVEVVQGATSAADATTGAELKAASELRHARLEGEKHLSKLRERAMEQMTQPASIEVHVSADGGSDSGDRG